jgi:20S proteasome alpha/beta subunit
VTLIVGIVCSDGVVMASDSSAALAVGLVPTIGQQPVTKIYKIGDDMLYASTGSIGVSQLIRDSLERLCSVKGHHKVQSSAEAMGSVQGKIVDQVKKLFDAANAVAPLIGQQAAGATVLCKSLVAFPFKEHPRLFQFDYSGAPEEATNELPFVSLGSGQNIADPFLALLKRALWSDTEPTVAEGRFAAAWTVLHVSKTNFGGVGLPLQMATLSMKDSKPQIEFMNDPSEHYEAVEAAEAALRLHVRPGAGAGAPPASPTPPAQNS